MKSEKTTEKYNGDLSKIYKTIDEFDIEYEKVKKK